MKEIYNILHFIKSPNYLVRQEKVSIIQGCKYLIKGFVIYYLFAFFVSIFLALLGNFGLIPQRSQIVNNMPLSFYLLVIIPLKEEFICRLFLRYSKLNISISLSVLIFCISFKIIHLGAVQSAVAAILTFSFSYFLCKINNKQLNHFWQKNIKYLYYGSSIIFGLLHLTNFIDLKLIHILFIPLLVANQIAMGFILGYYRITIKNGIILSVLLHMLINLPPLLATHLK